MDYGLTILVLTPFISVTTVAPLLLMAGATLPINKTTAIVNTHAQRINVPIFSPIK
jgi:hypothetical protein